MNIIIRNKKEALEAAEAIFDYTDSNLTMMEATDMPEESCKLAKELYEKAKAFKEFLS